MMIKCPRCGLRISSNVNTCFCCGLPVSKISMPVSDNTVSLPEAIPEPHEITQSDPINPAPIMPQTQSDQIIVDASEVIMPRKKKSKIPLIVLGCVIVVFIVSVFSRHSSDPDPVSISEEPEIYENIETEIIPDVSEDVSIITEETSQAEEVPPIDQALPVIDEATSDTTAQNQALKSAKNYLEYSPFSYLGLIDQLEFEGFSETDAQYAADNCQADWNEEALKKAERYLDTQAFSHSGLIKQLEFDKFTEEESIYGADNCGADWNEEAVKKAKQYTEMNGFSLENLTDQLEFEGFTPEEAQYGASEALK